MVLTAKLPFLTDPFYHLKRASKHDATFHAFPPNDESVEFLSGGRSKLPLAPLEPTSDECSWLPVAASKQLIQVKQ